MEALLDILRSLRLTGAVFLDAEFTAPWCVISKIAPDDCRPFGPEPRAIIGYHYVSFGELVAQVEGHPPMPVRQGEIIIVPRNDQHMLGSAPSLPAVNAHDLLRPGPDGGLARIVHGGGGERTCILCGFLGGDEQCNRITRILPPVLKMNVADGPSGKWIESSISFAASEMSSPPGQSTAVIAKLAELIFVEAIRRHLASVPPVLGGWAAGLRDPVVGRALSLLHGRSGHRWTADELAQTVGLSRAALVQRFTAAMGQAPMRYLASLRLNAAARRLAESHDPVSRIAYETGYESEAAFNRAFKREFGSPPGTWRKQATRGKAKTLVGSLK